MFDDRRIKMMYQLIGAADVEEMTHGRTMNQLGLMAELLDMVSIEDMNEIFSDLGEDARPYQMGALSHLYLERVLAKCTNPIRASIRLKEVASRMLTWGFCKNQLEWEDEENRIYEYLNCVFPGKRASADFVLLYGCGKRIFPMDRNVTRLLSRVEMADVGKGDFPKQIAKVIPDGAEGLKKFHTAIFKLSGDRCRRERPACIMCPLKSVCGRAGKM